MTPHSLLERFEAHLERARLLARPGTAIVAVSGGSDSVALLDLLHKTAAARGLRLVVAHADHQIQPESGVVEGLVRDLAARYGLPYEMTRLGLGAGASETEARRARYRWLRQVQAGYEARYLVTAHQQDDQIETVLLRVLAGSGLAGLAGIAARSRGGLVRPLLPFTREDLAAYVAALGLPHHDDPANRDPRHLRSWLRTAILPRLVERQGDSMGRNLLRVARHAARDARAWDAALDVLPDLSLRVSARGFEVARATLAGYDVSLAAALLSAAARRAGCVLSPTRARRLTAFAVRPSGRRMPLADGWTAEIAFDRLRVQRSATRTPDRVAVADPRGRATFGDFVVCWEPDTAPGALDRSGWTTWVREPGWELRPYRAGDRMVPLGGVGRRPVRRLLMEARVPRAAREHYPVVARGDTILWVPGICRSAADLPEPGTAAVRLDVTESTG